MLMPNVFASLPTMCTSSAFRSSAFDGMQPTLRQTPPQYFFSTTAVLKPSCAARIAATYPPGPAPRTTTSYCFAMGGVYAALVIPSVVEGPGWAVGAISSPPHAQVPRLIWSDLVKSALFVLTR